MRTLWAALLCAASSTASGQFQFIPDAFERSGFLLNSATGAISHCIASAGKAKIECVDGPTLSGPGPFQFTPAKPGQGLFVTNTKTGVMSFCFIVGPHDMRSVRCIER